MPLATGGGGNLKAVLKAVPPLTERIQHWAKNGAGEPAKVVGPAGYEPMKLVGSMKVPPRSTILPGALLKLPNVMGAYEFEPTNIVR